jgi:hypothetical protein
MKKGDLTLELELEGELRELLLLLQIGEYFYGLDTGMIMGMMSDKRGCVNIITFVNNGKEMRIGLALVVTVPAVTFAFCAPSPGFFVSLYSFPFSEGKN